MVVVTHNGEAHIEACLASLIEAGTSAGDVIVVDNASSDGTVPVVERQFPGIRVIAAQENLGYGGGVNLALRATGSKYLVVMNQDVTAGSGLVDGLVRALEAEPGVGLATPKVLLRSDPALVNACGNEMHYTGFTTCRGYRRESAAFTGTHAVTLVSGAVFAVRSELLRRLGGMDPLFYMYLEDADLSVRAALAGFRSICVPSVTAIHDWEPRFSAAKIHWLERNRVLLVLRIYRARTLLLMAPALFLAEILALGYAALHGPNVVAAKLRAWVWVVRSSPGIARSRRRIQRARTIPDRILLDSLAGGLNIDELPGRLPGVAAAAMNPLFRLWLGFLRRAVTW